MDYVEETNEALREGAPALDRLLSDLGRRIAFPPDIPFQAAEARRVDRRSDRLKPTG